MCLVPRQIHELKRRCAEKDQSVQPLEEQVNQLQQERERVQQELEEAYRERSAVSACMPCKWPSGLRFKAQITNPLIDCAIMQLMLDGCASMHAFEGHSLIVRAFNRRLLL